MIQINKKLVNFAELIKVINEELINFNVGHCIAEEIFDIRNDKKESITETDLSGFILEEPPFILSFKRTFVSHETYIK